MEQQVIQKKRKKKQKQESKSKLNLSYATAGREEKLKTPEQIKDKILNIMRYHIGKEDSISSVDLFISVFGVSPFELSIYKREFLWNMMKKILHNLRSDMILFTVVNVYNVYVLKTQEELELYKNGINARIKALLFHKQKAVKWVEEEKWKEVVKEDNSK